MMRMQAEQSLEHSTISHETRIFSDAVGALKRHKLFFCIMFVLPIVGGLAVVMLQPPLYSASSSVVVDSTGQDIVTVRNVLSDIATDNEAIIGELELLSSRELLEAVATHLALPQDPDFNSALTPSVWAEWRSRIAAALRNLFGSTREVTPSRPMNDVVDALRARLLIAPVGRSRVIRITVRAHDRVMAAKIVNTIAQAYTDEHLRLRNEARQQANDWIVGRLAELRTRADKSAQDVEAFRTTAGLVRGRDSLLVQQQATEASTQLTTARTRVAEARSKLADSEHALQSRRPDQMSSVLASPLIQQLRQREAEFDARRATLLSSFGLAHPGVAAANAQLGTIQEKIAAETQRIVVGLRDEVRAAEAAEAELNRQLMQTRVGVQEAGTLDVKLQELQRVAEVDNSLYQTFLTRSRETEPQVSFPTVNVRVLSTAVAPDRPISPNRPLIMAAAAVLGLILASVAVFLLDLTSRGLRTSADVERLVGEMPFGMIPFCRRRARVLERLRLQEAVAALWARIVVSGDNSSPKTIVVTSAVSGEGKSQLVRSLGTVAAEQGQRVLLIDGDLRCSSLTHRALRLQSHLGLSDLLRGEAMMDEVIVALTGPLHIMPAGRSRGNPLKLLASAEFRRMLIHAERAYDLVIIDSPPILIGADAWVLSRSAQMTLLLARWGQTSECTVKAALRQLLEVGAHNVRLVLSIVDVGQLAFYDRASMLSVSARSPQYFKQWPARS